MSSFSSHDTMDTEQSHEALVDKCAFLLGKLSVPSESNISKNAIFNSTESVVPKYPIR